MQIAKTVDLSPLPDPFVQPILNANPYINATIIIPERRRYANFPVCTPRETSAVSAWLRNSAYGTPRW